MNDPRSPASGPAGRYEDTLYVVFCTCPNEAAAGRLARHLVERRLAACVNVVPGLRSIYRWQGVIEDQTESLLIVKSPASLWPALEASIRQAHPYDTPEIVALEAKAVEEHYLNWLSAATRPPD